MEEDHSLCIKVESEVEVPASTAFLLLSDLRHRQEWDQYYRYKTVVNVGLAACIGPVLHYKCLVVLG